MKKLILLLLVATGATAQTTDSTKMKHVETEFTTSLNLSQTQFDNWAAGGDNAFTTLGTLFYRYHYTRGRFGLESRFDAKYGMNYIDKEMFKNQDVFQINELMTWEAVKHWSWSVDAELRSQFTEGERSRTDRTRVSNFMSPGTLKIGVGWVYRNEPWVINISPVGGSATFMLDEALVPLGLNGVPAGHKSKWQVGPSVRVIYDKAFAKETIRVRSEFYSFTNIKTAPTVRWDTKVDIKATKYLSTTLYWFMAYDKYANTQRRDHIQNQYSIAVGLSYTLKHKS